MSKVVTNFLVLLFAFICTTVWSQRYGFSPEEKQFQFEVLQAHNQYRSHHCVEPLVLDDELSQHAQMLAEQSAQFGGLSSSNTDGYGQNSYVKSHSFMLDSVDGDEPVRSWYNGMHYYDFYQGGFSLQTGGFTQVVWKSSLRLGVGIAFTKDRRSAFVIALYDPTGNVQNAFERNVRPGQC